MSPRNATEIGSRRHYIFDGVQYPSVTTILKLGTPKEWLGAWAAKVVAETAVSETAWQDLPADEAKQYLKRSPWVKRDKAADHGTSLHETLDAIVSDRPYLEDALSDGLLEFLAGYSVKPVMSEFQVVNTVDGYAGSGDLIADIYGERWLIDLKTSGFLDHTMRLQIAAYRYAESVFSDDRVEPMPKVDRTAVLWFPKDGRHWQFIEVVADETTYLQFLHVKAVHDFVRATEKTDIGEVVLPQVPEEAA